MLSDVNTVSTLSRINIFTSFRSKSSIVCAFSLNNDAETGNSDTESPKALSLAHFSAETANADAELKAGVKLNPLSQMIMPRYPLVLCKIYRAQRT